MTAKPAQPKLLKAIRIVKPYHAQALVDGWLCIKYLDGTDETLCTFADISKGDMILFGNATRSRPPAPTMQSECVWTYDEFHDKYDTGCGNGFQFIGGTSVENKMKYCPFCGGRILE